VVYCQLALAQLEEEVEEQEKVRVLPESCWLQIMEQLPVREVCMLTRVNRCAGNYCLQCVADTGKYSASIPDGLLQQRA
jgi:hypothetical protein